LIDPAFVADSEALGQALALLLARGQIGEKAVLPMSLPDTGIGEAATLRQLAPLVLGGAQRLDDPLAMAHMDPPTPWITWATTLWNASLNQNLLHPRSKGTKTWAWMRVLSKRDTFGSTKYSPSTLISASYGVFTYPGDGHSTRVCVGRFDLSAFVTRRFMASALRRLAVGRSKRH
jgi:hypothetical protein